RQWKVRQLFRLALHDDGPRRALHRLDAEEDRDRARARGAIEHHVDAFAAGDLLDARERVFGIDVDDMIRAQLARDLQARAVFLRAGDDDERGARLLADHGLRQALLSRALDQHRGVVADAAV